jgi:uncharacterized SAM-binding protein YcdF (DUF218 family)
MPFFACPLSRVTPTSQAPTKIPCTPCRRLRRMACWLIFGCSVVLAAYVCRAPLLRGVAEAWIVDDVPTKADALVVLGGGVQYRPFAAARLYKKGLAPKILIMDIKLGATDEMGLTQPQKDLTRRLLLHQGVPENAIEMVGRTVSNTAEESVGVFDWAQQHGARNLIVVTEIFHTRRARWIFRKRFKGTGTDIQMVAVEPVEYQAKNWWHSEQGLIAFQEEIFKFLYYRFKY